MSTLSGAQEQPQGLGVGFWAVWVAGLALVVGGFALGVNFIRDQMTSYSMAFAGGGAVIAFTSALVGLCMVPQIVRVRRGIDRPMRAPQKRYMMRFMPAMFGYVFLLLAATTFWKVQHPSGVLLWLVAIAPALPLLLAVRAIALLIVEEDDEVMRMRNLYAFVWSTCGALGICSVWGFLDMFGAVPHVELWAVFPIWALCLFPAQVFAKRRFA